MTRNAACRKSLLVIAVLLALFPTVHTEADESPTAAAVSFLKVGMGARAQAMGGAQVADCDGTLALFWNPAALTGARGRHLLFSHNRFALDIRQTLLAYSQSGFGVGAKYAGVGGIEVRSGPTDEPEGMTEAWDLALYGGYGRRVLGDLSLGLVGKLIVEKLHESDASAFAFDVGMRYEHGNFRVGAALQHLSKGITFREEEFHLPTMVKVGMALSVLGKRFTLASDLDQPLLEGNRRKLHLGAEVVLKEMLSLRGGYNYQSKRGALGDWTGLTTGVGLDYRGVEIGYSFAPSENMGDIHQISMLIDLERPPTFLPPGVPPPDIYIQSPPTPGHTTEVKHRSIQVVGHAKGKEEIDRVEIDVNGEEWSIVRGAARGVDLVWRLDFSKEVVLNEGANHIDIIAYDINGRSTERSLTVRCIRELPEIWAAVIGISDYVNVRRLNYADDDASAFYEYLTGLGIPEDHIVLLLNDQATLDRVKRVLGDELRRKAGKEDQVIIYFAGHGAVEDDPSSLDPDKLSKYLLMYNTHPDTLYSTGLPMEEIARIFGRIRSDRVVYIGDTCYSGASGGRTVLARAMRANLSEEFLNRMSQGEGRMILTASGANEVAFEKDGHGVFTYYLLEALRGEADYDGDRFITVDEVYRYISKKVPEATEQSQHPVKKGETSREEILLGKILAE